MPKRTKELISQDLHQRFNDLRDAVFIDYGGITAAESVDFRALLREQGARMTVIKNSLATRAFHDLGVDLPDTCFRGPTAIVHGDVDAITTTKTIANWAKKHKKELSFKAGLLEGRPLEAQETKKLTTVPSVEELKQLVVSIIAAPLTGLVGVTNGILASVPSVLSAIADKQKEGE